MGEDGFYLPTKSSFLQLTLCHWMSSEDTAGDKDTLTFRYTKDMYLKQLLIFFSNLSF